MHVNYNSAFGGDGQESNLITVLSQLFHQEPRPQFHIDIDIDSNQYDFYKLLRFIDIDIKLLIR